MMWNGDGHWGSGDWATLVLIVVVVIAVIVAIVFLVRSLSRTGGTSSTAVPSASTGGPESPQDILKRRYAAGEIDREEYLQKLGDLQTPRADGTVRSGAQRTEG
jgi:putative membrane protein